MLLSFVAVVGGFVVIAFLVGITTALASKLPMGKPDPTCATAVSGTYLVTNLVLGFLCAVVGGYFCGRIAPRSPEIHIAALVGVLGTMSLLTIMTTGAAPGQPKWYPYIIGLLGVTGIIAGGALRISLT